jgi:hypothetical protein
MLTEVVRWSILVLVLWKSSRPFYLPFEGYAGVLRWRLGLFEKERDQLRREDPLVDVIEPMSGLIDFSSSSLTRLSEDESQSYDSLTTERLIRNAIQSRQLSLAKEILSDLKSCILSEINSRKRTVLFVVLESCRRSNQIKNVVQLLSAVPAKILTELLLNHNIRFV